MQSRDGTDNVLYSYYNKLLHLRVAKSIVNDIYKLGACLQNFSMQTSVPILSKIIYKYKRQVNIVGRELTGIVTLGQPALYQEKTEEDIWFDLVYMMRVLMIIGAVKTGLAPSISFVVQQIKLDGLNLNALDLYEI